MNRLCGKTKEELKDYLLSISGKGRQQVLIKDAVMPYGYNEDKRKQFWLMATGTYVTLSIDYDSNFVSPIKSVQRFVREGNVYYFTLNGFIKWVLGDLKRALEMNAETFAAQLSESQKISIATKERKRIQSEAKLAAHLDDVLTKSRNADPGEIHPLAEWLVSVDYAEWRSFSNFAETQKLLETWLPGAQGYSKFERVLLAPQEKQSVEITFDSQPSFTVIPSEGAAAEVVAAKALAAGATEATIKTVLVAPTRRSKGSVKSSEIYFGGIQEAPMTRSLSPGYWRQPLPPARPTIRQSSHKMQMTREVYEQIAATVGKQPAETGGILGGSYEDGVITHYHFDETAAVTKGTYQPSAEEINTTLRNEWNPQGVRLLGVVHSHPPGYRTPTASDSDDPHASDFSYVRSIMKRIDERREADDEKERSALLERMFLPIVMPEGEDGAFEIIPFAIAREGGSYVMEAMEIEIIEPGNSVAETPTTVLLGTTEKLVNSAVI